MDKDFVKLLDENGMAKVIPSNYDKSGKNPLIVLLTENFLIKLLNLLIETLTGRQLIQNSPFLQTAFRNSRLSLNPTLKSAKISESSKNSVNLKSSKTDSKNAQSDEDDENQQFSIMQLTQPQKLIKKLISLGNPWQQTSYLIF